MNAEEAVQLQKDDFYELFSGKIDTSYTVEALTSDFGNCLQDMITVNQAQKNRVTFHIRGNLPFQLQCQVLKAMMAQNFKFVINGQKFAPATHSSNHAVGIVVTV